MDILATPAHIVPEWYFLAFYAGLKSTNSKITGLYILIVCLVYIIGSDLGCYGLVDLWSKVCGAGVSPNNINNYVV